MSRKWNKAIYFFWSCLAIAFIFTSCKSTSSKSNAKDSTLDSLRSSMKNAQRNSKGAINTTDYQNPAEGLDTIYITRMKFKPAELTVKKGDTVVWVNQGMVDHNVTQLPDTTWTSGKILRNGGIWKKVIEQDLDYFCSIHPTMIGKIRIK